jgi:T5orf172 domain
MICAMGYVYILRSGDRDIFKIGKAATDLDKRVRALATGNSEPLTRFDVIETDYYDKCETYLHHRLRSKRSGRSAATEFFEVEPDELAELILDARNYVEEVLPKMAEAERLAEQECDERIVQPSEEHWEMYRTLVLVREKYDTLQFDKDRLEAELKLAIGAAGGYLANWKAVSSQRFDSEAFSRNQPELYQAFLRESRSRRFTLL